MGEGRWRRGGWLGGYVRCGDEASSCHFGCGDDGVGGCGVEGVDGREMSSCGLGLA